MKKWDCPGKKGMNGNPILSKKVYTYMCPISSGFRDRAISLGFGAQYCPSLPHVNQCEVSVDRCDC
jgi:hypothetical protein